jgi:hypothetical protein
MERSATSADFELHGITTPLLFVFDMLESLAIYRDLLGFEIVSASPEVSTSEGHFSHWMWLRSGSVNVMLNTQYDSNERPGARIQTDGDPRGTSFSIGCTDVDAAYIRLTARGLRADAVIFQEIR